jgi:hypothetical protein
MEALAKLVGDNAKTGAMIQSGGLASIDISTRIRLSNGEITIIDGPFAETKEVVGGFAEFEFKTKEDAVESTRRFMEIHQKHWPGWEGETEIRQIYGPDDFPPQA